MSFFVRLLVYMHIYEYAVRKTKKKEKGVRRVKGIRETLREIDAMTSKNKNID